MRRVFARTGLLGGPVQPLFPAPEFLADAMVEYYMRHEPAWALVAEAGGPDTWAGLRPLRAEGHGGAEDKGVQVAGYVLGCPDTAARDRRLVQMFPELAWSFVRHGLAWSRAGLLLAVRALLEQPAEAAARRGRLVARDYPAHFHLAVDPGFRRLGIATALMERLLGLLRGAGVPGVHLETTNRHREALALYQQLGFAQLAERRTRLFDHLLPPGDPPVRWILMGKRLVP